MSAAPLRWFGIRFTDGPTIAELVLTTAGGAVRVAPLSRAALAHLVADGARILAADIGKDGPS